MVSVEFCDFFTYHTIDQYDGNEDKDRRYYDSNTFLAISSTIIQAILLIQSSVFYSKDLQGDTVIQPKYFHFIFIQQIITIFQKTMLPFTAPSEQTQTQGPARPFEDFPLFPPLPHLEARMVQALCSQNSWLIAQVKGIKQSLEALTAEVREKLTQLVENTAMLDRINSFERPKKKFKKAIECPFSHCAHRYSSKIALNCHIRTKHQTKTQ